MVADALSSHVDKWTAAEPELALALRFADAASRPRIAALICLEHEIVHAALHIAERDVALVKLNWWAEELAALAAGAARHPLTQTLGGTGALAATPRGQGGGAASPAWSMREAAPAATFQDLLARYRQFAECWAPMQQALYSAVDADAWIEARSLALALRDALALHHALQQDRLPLPMELLARHQLSRSELAQPSAARDAILREQISFLSRAMKAVKRSRLTVHAAVQLRADEYRCQRMHKSGDVLGSGHDALARLPLSSAWVAWRAARTMQRMG